MIRAIRAIIVKELRENLLCAMLIGAITTGLLVVGIYQGLDTGLPLVQKSLLAFCMIMYPLAGVALGFLQVNKDYRRGRWSFVAHHPISLGRQFGCKIAMGVAIYLLATALPLFVIYISVSIPGYVPGPVTWDMLLPAMAYVVAGLVWYATGLLIASRQARWFGSRLMPVSIPILGMLLFTNLAFTFLDAVWMLLPCALLQLIAAWGWFVSAEGSPRLPMVSRICTGLGVSLGWVMCIAVVMTIVGGLIDPYVNHRQEYSTYYKLDQHGDLQVVQGSYSAGKDTLAGEMVYLNDPQLLSRDRRARSEGFLRADSYARLFDSSPHERWFCVPSRGVVEGYDTRGGRYIGSIGQDGFAPVGRTARPFDQLAPSVAMTVNNELFSSLITRNAVYSLDVPARQVRQLFASLPDDPILGVANLPSVGAHAMLNNAEHVVVTRSRIHFLIGSKEDVSIPREAALNQHYISVGRTDDGNYVAGSYTGPVGWNPVDVFIYDRAGKRIRQINKPAEVRPIAEVGERWWFMAGVFIPSPPLFFMTVFVAKWLDGARGGWVTTFELLGVIVMYLAIGFAMLRVRRAKVGSMVAWLVIIGGLGLSGIFLLMSMWEKPPSVRCAGCGRRRLISEERCGNCQRQAEGPVMLGIEIFDTVVTPGVAD